MEITPQDLKAKLDAAASIVVVDVREPEEYAICHLNDVVHIPLSQFAERGAQELNSDDDLVFYCHHGMRSMQAAMFLKQKGFKRVASLRGGIDAWSQEIDSATARY